MMMMLAVARCENKEIERVSVDGFRLDAEGK